MSKNIIINLPDLAPVKAEVSGIVEAAKAVTIATTEERNEAAVFERALIKKEKSITDHYKPIKKSLDAHKRVILEQERGYLAPVKEARDILKQTELLWDTEQQRVADEQEKKIAAELCRREEEKRLAAAEAAQEAGDEEKVEAILERPIETPKINLQPPKAPGQSVRTTWKAEVVDFPKLLVHIAANPALAHLVQPNEQAIRAMARTQKDALNLPGVRVYSEKSLTTRL